MTDFYSLLRQSIIDRGLKSPVDREDAYAQARTALIRRLWALEPPLAEDEIDARIGQFDVAVDRIETDLIEVFAEDGAFAGDEIEDEEAEAPRPLPVRRQADPPRRPVPRDEPSLDEPEDEAPAARMTARQPSRAEMLRQIEERRLAVEAALRGPVDDDPPVIDAYAPYDDDRDQPIEDAIEVDYHEGFDDPDSPPLAGGNADDEPLDRPSRSGDRRVAMLLAAIGVLAVVLIGGLGSLLLRGDGEVAVAEAPAAEADRPVPEVPATKPVAEEPADAARIPEETLNVADTFNLFDGRDPTVFDSGPNNPIGFEGDAEEGFVRVATSAGSTGARVIVGPGLASRIAGHRVRVVIVAREASENGAASFRMAYQSGVAISHWQSAELSSDFTPLGLVWRVPALRTDLSGDAILIEPGIPGDGSAVEIRSVKIDLLAD